MDNRPFARAGQRLAIELGTIVGRRESRFTMTSGGFDRPVEHFIEFRRRHLCQLTAPYSIGLSRGLLGVQHNSAKGWKRFSRIRGCRKSGYRRQRTHQCNHGRDENQAAQMMAA